MAHAHAQQPLGLGRNRANLCVLPTVDADRSARQVLFTMTRFIDYGHTYGSEDYYDR